MVFAIVIALANTLLHVSSSASDVTAFCSVQSPRCDDACRFFTLDCDAILRFGRTAARSGRHGINSTPLSKANPRRVPYSTPATKGLKPSALLTSFMYGVEQLASHNATLRLAMLCRTSTGTCVAECERSYLIFCRASRTSSAAPMMMSATW